MINKRQTFTYKSFGRISTASRLIFYQMLFVIMLISHVIVAPAAGTTSWLAILCEYPDVPDSLPPTSHFQALLFDNAFPSVDHWLREISYNSENLQGSQIAGPYTLQQPYAGYNFDHDPLDDDDNDFPSFVMDVFIPDIMSQVTQQVDITQFSGFFFIMNEDPTNNRSYGPALTSFQTGGNYNGQEYVYIVMGPGFGWNHQRIIAHETVHTYGVKHSSRPDYFTTIPHWDNMGGDGTCDPPQDPYGCVGIHTMAWHKLIAGWIDQIRIYNPGNIGAGIVNIERLEFPPFAPGNYLMAGINVPGSSLFYTVEYRRQLGYDSVGAIPGEAVILHDVDMSRTDIFGNPDFYAKVLDQDGNGDPNDAGGMWIPGETFVSGSGVIVHVESMDNERAVVSVSNQERDPVYADKANSGFENGMAADPWNTVSEAYASVTPSGNVYIKPGSYNETLIMSKPSVINRWGSSGEVTIGQ